MWSDDLDHLRNAGRASACRQPRFPFSLNAYRGDLVAVVSFSRALCSPVSRLDRGTLTSSKLHRSVILANPMRPRVRGGLSKGVSNLNKWVTVIKLLNNGVPALTGPFAARECCPPMPGSPRGYFAFKWHIWDYMSLHECPLANINSRRKCLPESNQSL